MDDQNVMVLDQSLFRLETPQDSHMNDVWQPLQLPDSWNSSRPDIGGMGIYRFELNLNVAPDRLWALLLPRVSNNAAVYLNGALLGTHGDFKGHTMIWNTPFLVTIPSGLLKSDHNIIEIKVAAKANCFGRLLPPLIGAETFIEPRYEQLYFSQVILSEICAVFALSMGICILMIWWYRRQELYGWFALGGISWTFYALYFFVTQLPLPLEQWIIFCFSCSFIMLSSMLLFLCHFMGWQKKYKNKVILGYALLGILVVMLVPNSQVFNSIRWVMVGYALMYSILGVALLNALRFEKSKQHAITSLVGIGVNIGLGLHDWANLFFLLNQPYLLQFGQPLIFLVMGRHLLKDYMTALHKSEASNAELDQRIHQREQELKISLKKIQQAERDKLLLKERERIMADIHDGVGGHLVSALAISESPLLDGKLIAQTIHQALDELRIVIDSLDPDERKLSFMLASFRHRYDPRLRKQGIHVHWKFNQLDQLDRVGPEVSLQLLRILQELITNIIKHSQANHVSIEIGAREHPSMPCFFLCVADNGIGFNATDSIGRGLGNLKRRATSMKGCLKFTPQNKGIKIELTFSICT